MIGHYLLALESVAEDRTLTETFEAYPQPETIFEVSTGTYRIKRREKTRCLVDVACGLPAGTTWKDFTGRDDLRGLKTWQYAGDITIGSHYDRLCRRFGAPRVNNAIRNRILSNRARRVLQVEMAYVG